MKPKKPQPSPTCTIRLSFWIPAFSFLASSSAFAGKLDVALGFFQLTAKTQKTERKISNLGVYKIGYHHPIFRNLDVGVSYTLIMSSVIGGDLGYGLDVSANWFPITGSGRMDYKSRDATFTMDEPLRPYAGITFNQRQFQSIQAGYAGFGFNLGTEYTLYRNLSLKAEARYLILTGPSQGSVTEMDGYVGTSISF